MTGRQQIKRRIAALVQQMPWLMKLVIRLMRWTQAHFTAGVVGVVLNERGEVLVVKHVLHPDYPWGLPGGWLGHRETPIEALQRELHEELAIEVAVTAPLLIDQGVYPRHLDIAYLCQALTEVQGLSIELLEYRWVGMDDLPPMTRFHAEAVDALRARHDRRS